MSEPIKTVGYVGLGIMGTPMASNLIQAGFELTVWNRTASKGQALTDLGAKQAASPAELASAAPDVICINVTDTPDVEEVLFGDGGIAHGAQPGLIVIDNSTINPVATRDFAQRLEARQVTLLDAPVSGGDVGARQGTLSVMVGGPEEAFARCRPLFEAVGKNITHLGPVGSGQVCKACNQIAVAVNMMGVCEALAMARQCGLDLEKMISVVSGGAGGSWQLANLGPKIASGDYDPGFMINLVLKDLAIIADAARSQGLPLAGTALAEGYFRSAATHGDGALGTQAMAKTVQRLGGFCFQD